MLDLCLSLVVYQTRVLCCNLLLILSYYNSFIIGFISTRSQFVHKIFANMIVQCLNMLSRVDGDGVSGIDGRRETATRYSESNVTPISINSKATGTSTYDEPVQPEPPLTPLITLQYVPSGSEVLNVALQLLSALLIAINPAEPSHLCRRMSRL
jgi:hypothetical protein